MEIVPIDIFGVQVEVPFPAPYGLSQAKLEEFGAKICDPNKGLGLRARVGHRAQLGLRHVTQVLIVLAAHDAGANQANTKGCIQQPVLLSLLLGRF